MILASNRVPFVVIPLAEDKRLSAGQTETTTSTKTGLMKADHTTGATMLSQEADWAWLTAYTSTQPRKMLFQRGFDHRVILPNSYALEPFRGPGNILLAPTTIYRTGFTVMQKGVYSQRVSNGVMSWPKVSSLVFRF